MPLGIGNCLCVAVYSVNLMPSIGKDLGAIPDAASYIENATVGR